MVATASPALTQRRRHTTPLTLTLPGPSGALRPAAVTPLMEARLKRLRRNHASHIRASLVRLATSLRANAAAITLESMVTACGSETKC